MAFEGEKQSFPAMNMTFMCHLKRELAILQISYKRCHFYFAYFFFTQAFWLQKVHDLSIKSKLGENIFIIIGFVLMCCSNEVVWILYVL